MACDLTATIRWNNNQAVIVMTDDQMGRYVSKQCWVYKSSNQQEARYSVHPSSTPSPAVILYVRRYVKQYRVAQTSADHQLLFVGMLWAVSFQESRHRFPHRNSIESRLSISPSDTSPAATSRQLKPTTTRHALHSTGRPSLSRTLLQNYTAHNLWKFPPAAVHRRVYGSTVCSMCYSPLRRASDSYKLLFLRTIKEEPHTDARNTISIRQPHSLYAFRTARTFINTPHKWFLYIWPSLKIWQFGVKALTYK